MIESAKLVQSESSISKEELTSLLDKTNRKVAITDEAISLISEAMNEPEFDGFKFVETLATYQTALDGTRGSLVDFINAVKFTSFLESYEGNLVQAYIKTFIHREFVQERMNAPTSSKEYKELSYSASRYRKSPLVVNILTQAEIPLYLLFQGYRYKAVNRLVYEMENAPLARDRINASDKLLTHIKPPENLQLEVNVKTNETNIVDKYEEAMRRKIEMQKQALAMGGSIEDIINVKVIEEEEDDK